MTVKAWAFDSQGKQHIDSFDNGEQVITWADKHGFEIRRTETIRTISVPAPAGLEIVSIKGATAYLREWMNLTAVKRLHSSGEHHYFSAKTIDGIRKTYRVDITATGHYFNVWEAADEGEAWEWADAISTDSDVFV